MTDLADEIERRARDLGRSPAPTDDAISLGYWIAGQVQPLLAALRASRPEPITGGPEIKLVEMQDWSQGYAQDAPPVWRVELGGYCADFEHEQAARNWADSIVRYASRPEPAADAVERVAKLEAELAREDRSHSETIDQRDAAESALSEAYLIVTGRAPKWSNLFGYREALDDIRDALPAPQPGEVEVERSAVVKWLRRWSADLISRGRTEAGEWADTLARDVAQGCHRTDQEGRTR